jgi:hypothetical protein
MVVWATTHYILIYNDTSNPNVQYNLFQSIDYLDTDLVQRKFFFSIQTLGGFYQKIPLTDY